MYYITVLYSQTKTFNTKNIEKIIIKVLTNKKKHDIISTTKQSKPNKTRR